MTSFSEIIQINATQAAGLLSFGITAVVCFVAWRSVAKSIWGWLTIIYAAITIEILVDGRHWISNTLRTILRSTGFYQDRGIWQILLVVLFLAIAGAIALKMSLVSRQQEGATPKATYVTALTLMLFVVETISPHKIDAILYHKAGSVLVIGWIWAAFATLTVTLTISALRRHSKPDLPSSSRD